MVSIINNTKTYWGADKWVSYHTMNATVSTLVTANITTANVTTLDATAIKVWGVAVKMPVLSWEYTTTGWAAAEVATIAGVEVWDIVIATLKDNGTSSVTLLTAAENTADTVDFTFSANPLADTIVSYIILR